MSNEIEINSNVVAVKVDMDNRTQLLEYMATKLKDYGYVKDSYIGAIVQREEKFSTGLELEKFGVAIPHTDAIHVKQSTISIATLEHPIEFYEMGNPDKKVKVHIVMMLAMAEGKDQVSLLTRIMGLVQEPELLKAMYEANQDELVEMISSHLI
jgi:PTS system galactitol-specific IIA component